MKIWKTLLPVIAVVILTLTLVGCKAKNEKISAEHPNSDQSTSEQQAEESEHPASEHPASEHPQ